ncbi:SpoIIE family protein phosphatase [Streptomyces sp. NPDC085524]|uniref:SpoIIE family protein phosphatase n=1 Tax=Streptomyces sp. NPDC085524 TaxID=3365728 RepID=UPI0037D8A96F
METDPTATGDGASPEVLALAKVVARLRAEVADLEGLASATAVVERAKGVLMAREGFSADAAYEALVRDAALRSRTLMEQCWITLGGIRPRPAAVPPPPSAADGGPAPDAGDSVFSSDRYLIGHRAASGSRMLLARLAGALAGARTPDDVAEVLREALRGPLAVDGVMIYLNESGRLELVGHAGVEEALAAQWRDIPPVPGVAPLDATTSGEPRWLDDPERDAETYQLIGSPERWRTRAWIPLPGKGPTAGSIGFFRRRAAPFGDADKDLLQRAVLLCGGALRAFEPSEAGQEDEEVAAVQAVLDTLPGSTLLLSPLRSPDGEVEDYRVEAAAPGAVDVAGRRGKELVGRRILETYPTVAGTALWQGYAEALETGTVYEGEPFEYQEAVGGVLETSVFSVRAARLGDRLVVSWIRHDTGEREIRRIATMGRLGNLGWAEWDLTTDTINWSEQVYTIFGRMPEQGPVTLEELPRYVVPDDLPTLADAVQRLLGEGAPVDQPFRVVTATGVRHLRIVAEAETDAAGTPVGVHGLFQDLTPLRDAELALLESERSVLLQRGMLRAERAIAAGLRSALLPVPEQSIDLVGLCVDVAYVPSDTGVNVGGDWYSAIELPDGSALFVVGDVAGHGLEAVGTMAQLRFTAKGMIVTGSALPDAMSRLNRLLMHTTTGLPATTATMIMMRYRPASRRMSWVRAGHLPPLLVRGGEARFLPLPEGPLLGASFDSAYVEETLDLEPGDHLLLYTDGLIEVPGEDIGEGLVRLAEAAVGAMGAGSPDALADLLSALHPARRDDVCVVDIHLPRHTAD